MGYKYIELIERAAKELGKDKIEVSRDSVVFHGKVIGGSSKGNKSIKKDIKLKGIVYKKPNMVFHVVVYEYENTNEIEVRLTMETPNSYEDVVIPPEDIAQLNIFENEIAIKFNKPLFFI